MTSSRTGWLRPLFVVITVAAIAAAHVAVLERELGRGRRGFVAEDPASLSALALAKEAAAGDHPVLIVGEPGSGRRTLAAEIHARSRRSAGEFVTLDCRRRDGHPGALRTVEPDVPGILEIAEEGTLFVDEIDLIGDDVRLTLRSILDRSRSGDGSPGVPDVRVIGSARAELPQDGPLGALLSAVRIDVPPLRDRRRDIVPIAARLARGESEGLGRRLTLDEGAEQWLAQQSWPGNADELADLMSQAVTATSGGTITAVVLEECASARR